MIDIRIKKILDGAQGKITLDFDGQIPLGKTTTLFGPSGAGKTSFLKILAGLIKTDQGFIKIKDEIWLDTDNSINLPPQQRSIGFVFQDYALFPNMTVRQNLEFAVGNNPQENLIQELIETTDLNAFSNKKPHQLSGGQQQRVALARAIARQPKLLLLDEPLSAIDQKMRIKLQGYLLKVQERFKPTTILVSHDVNEVIKLSDWVINIENGQTIRSGTAIELFTHQSSSENPIIEAEILKIIKDEPNSICQVLLGTSIIDFPIQNKLLSKFQIGQKVRLVGKNGKFELDLG